MANTGFDRQAANMLGKRRRNRRWIPVVVCLVLLVSVGTFYFMIQEGQAMARKDMMLDCAVQTHTHTAECFDGEGGLICGYANYLVHEHNDDCYDKNGVLVCTLPELKEHHHTEACYDKQLVAECGIEESVGHIHGEGCYESRLTCGLAEGEGHAHTEDCYDENGQLTCGLEAGGGHVHTDACYEKVLTCGMEEGEGGHFHTEACKEYELVLTCQKPEVGLHTHGDECYEYFDEDGESIPMEEALKLEERIKEQVESGEEPVEELPQRVLACGLLQTEEHEHGNDCFKKIEVEPSSVVESSGLESSGLASSELESSGLESSGLESSELESSGLESSELESSGLESSELESSGLESSGLESSGLESGDDVSSQPDGDGGWDGETSGGPEEGLAAYEDAGLKVTATFEGEVPEGAHLVVERLEDPNELAQKQAKLKRAMEDEEYSLHALLQVGLVDEDGEAVEFDSPVALTAEFRGEGASVQGGKVCAVAYREAPENPDLETVPGMVLDRELAEVLSVQLGENGGAVTEIEEETLLGFGSKAPVQVDADAVDGAKDEDGTENDGMLHINQDFSYSTDSMVNLVFHIEGEVALEDLGIEPKDVEDEGGADGKAGEDDGPAVKWGEESQAPEDGGKDDMEPVVAGMSDVHAVSGVSSVAPVSSLAGEDEAAGSSDVEEDAAEEDGESAPEPPADGEEEKALGGATLETGKVLPANVEVKLEDTVEFTVTEAKQGDKEFEPYEGYKQDTDDELPTMQVFTYGLRYAGKEVDLAGMQVRMKLLPTEELTGLAEKVAEEMAQNAASLDGEGQPGEDGSVFLTVFGDTAVESDEAVEKEETYLISGENDEVDTQAMGDAVSSSLLSTGSAQSDVQELASFNLLDAGEPMVALNGSENNSFALAISGQYNPVFTVDYYSYLDVVDKASSGQLAVIDTRGGKLPQNGTGENPPNSNGLMHLTLNTDGTVKTNKELVPIYSGMTCKFFEKPGLAYFDAMLNDEGIRDNSSYELYQVWVLKENGNSDNLNSANWDIYGLNFPESYPKAVSATNPVTLANGETLDKYIHFTNKPVEKQPGNGHYYIYLKEKAKLRLVYKTKEAEKTYPTNFFDYDISGSKHVQNGVTTLYTLKQGINNDSNYKGIGSKYAFGLKNTGTGLGDITWENEGKNNLLNAGNYEGAWNNPVFNSYAKCTFSLVKGLDASGGLLFSDGIVAPDGFLKSANTLGTESYSGNLNFKRTGDTYTLQTASSGAGTAGNLEKFNNPKCGNTTHNDIWTNNFWPMDEKPGNDGLFGNYQTESNFRFSDVPNQLGATNKYLPKSDDGTDHNSYFGMHYTLNFDLAKEYVGPLEYLFFGDDDMWVFLTPVNENGVAQYGESKLVCDIGGVHPAVGEYVNLWDYMGREVENGVVKIGEADKKYQLDFFYTERGASGSTCWMQFTLPSVHGKYTGVMQDYGVLRVKKEVTHEVKSGDLPAATPPAQTVDDDTGFIFKLQLQNFGGVFGDNLENVFFHYTKYDANNNKIVGTDGIFAANTVSDGGYFTLKNGESIVIEHLPVGTKYTVTEEYKVVDAIVETTPAPGATTPPTVEVIGKNPENDYYASATRTRDQELLPYNDDAGTEEFGRENARVMMGEITNDDLGAKFQNNIAGIQTVTYKNTVYAYELPKTGGSGVLGYIWGGTALLGAAGLALVYKSSRKRGKEGVQKS